MRLRLTYLLLLCLLFFKGHSCVLLQEHKNSHYNSSAQNIKNDNSTDLASYQDLVLLSQESLCRNDDDNEPGSTRKKATSFTSSAAHNNIFALSCLLNFFKANHLPDKHFWSYPDRYLFIGVIKL